MNPVRWKRLALVFLIVSSAVLCADIVLPVWKSPQRAVYVGPITRPASDGSTISGFYVPTVDNSTTITVSVDDFIPGAVDITIFPSQTGTVAPSGTPVYTKTPQFNLTFSFTTQATQAYGIFIYSRNFTKFTLIVQATYSPYFWVSNYTSIAIAAVFGSAVLLYYYSFNSRRWVLEQKAIREAKNEEDKGR